MFKPVLTSLTTFNSSQIPHEESPVKFLLCYRVYVIVIITSTVFFPPGTQAFGIEIIVLSSQTQSLGQRECIGYSCQKNWIWDTWLVFSSLVRILKIFVQPLGPQYEVVLKGEVISSGSKPLPPEPHCSDIPLILSNKQFLTWGGIPLGRTQ